jgi:hypothetical protein
LLIVQGLPGQVRNAVIDMAYNLGCAGLNSFKSMKASLQAKRWAQGTIESHRFLISSFSFFYLFSFAALLLTLSAATDAGNSRWCGQVGSRCARDQACIRSGA